ncbi:Histone-lysine N-methyltransferase [Nymphaea thermarum]|nr:Histone-lysine N-methyltransferase [Nymphaea thermarum]
MKRPASGCGDQPNLFLEFAELILPWLPPPDLASVSSTCRTLRRTTQAITERRCSDASRGLEKYPIPFFNPVDDEPYAYFLYTSHAVLGNRSSSIFSQSWGGNYSCPSKFGPAHELSSLDVDVSEGCCCRECSVGHDGRGGCPCLGFNELLSGVELSVGSRMECGNSCSCSIDCPNRPTQRGIAVKLRIVKHLKKGWGLHAAEFVPRGEFLCEYVGELLTTEESRKRQQEYDKYVSTGHFSPALLVVREHLPSGKACLRLNIDATRIGNVARFINHACDGGNLSTVLLRHSGALLPRLCFFAARDIQEGEELAFSYGDVRQGHRAVPCFCGSSNCSGLLPYEQT